MGCCSTNGKSLIVTTVNPICCSRPVHPGRKPLQFVALKARKTSPLQTIIKTSKTKTLFSVFSIEYIFLPQGD